MIGRCAIFYVGLLAALQAEVRLRQLERPERNIVFLFLDLPSLDYRRGTEGVNRASLESLSVALFDSSDSVIAAASAVPMELSNRDPIFRPLLPFSTPLPDGSYRARVQFSLTLWEQVGQGEFKTSASDILDFQITIRGNVPTLKIEARPDGDLEICWPTEYLGWTLQAAPNSDTFFTNRITKADEGKNIHIVTPGPGEIFRLVK